VFWKKKCISIPLTVDQSVETDYGKELLHFVLMLSVVSVIMGLKDDLNISNIGLADSSFKTQYSNLYFQSISLHWNEYILDLMN